MILFSDSFASAEQESLLSFVTAISSIQRGEPHLSFFFPLRNDEIRKVEHVHANGGDNKKRGGKSSGSVLTELPSAQYLYLEKLPAGMKMRLVHNPMTT